MQDDLGKRAPKYPDADEDKSGLLKAPQRADLLQAAHPITIKTVECLHPKFPQLARIIRREGLPKKGGLFILGGGVSGMEDTRMLVNQNTSV
ncbi:hypothetical protein NPIL_91621 [Nephila pilipes]|uniref:Uncharacterized protein n=1 Tax=Nephila pilipes TaxID=299642 RepID=A0A8X6TPD8_NEPPI|nr:hypothetical protein NPIL_91621 [Nephila pilipes]